MFHPPRRFPSAFAACPRKERPKTGDASESRRRVHAAKLGRLGKAFAFDHRLRVSEPTLSLAQMRHRAFGQGVEGACAALAAEPRKFARASPGDNFATRAMRTPSTLHPLMARYAQRIRPTASIRALVLRGRRLHLGFRTDPLRRRKGPRAPPGAVPRSI